MDHGWAHLQASSEALSSSGMPEETLAVAQAGFETWSHDLKGKKGVDVWRCVGEASSSPSCGTMGWIIRRIGFSLCIYSTPTASYPEDQLTINKHV